MSSIAVISLFFAIFVERGVPCYSDGINWSSEPEGDMTDVANDFFVALLFLMTSFVGGSWMYWSCFILVAVIIFTGPAQVCV